MALKVTPNKNNLKKEHNLNKSECNSSSKTKDGAIRKHRRKISSKQDFKKLMLILFHILEIMALSTLSRQCQPYSYAIPFNDWTPIIAVNLLYTVQPMPVIAPSQTFPFVTPIIIPPITPSPILLPSAMSPVSSYYECGSQSVDLSQVESVSESKEFENGIELEDPLDYYLALPKDLFPSAKMMTIDPNQLIDEFCRLSDVLTHAPWILDLEFGIPKSLIRRPIPSYNVKFHSIHCKNTPEAIHPGFESCNQSFKEAFLFYYDCIVSVWYRGYICLYSDVSVENFQSWLQLPMQRLGMSWS